MAYADTLSGDIEIRIHPKIVTTEGNINGIRDALFKAIVRLSDGSGSGAATGFFMTAATITTGGVTLSLADSADPLGAAGDDTPTMDPEGLKLKCIAIKNKDTTNYVTVKRATTTGDANIFSGSTDTMRIDPNGGFFIWYSPAGSNAMSDGVDDELTLTADTASCSCDILYIFG